MSSILERLGRLKRPKKTKTVSPAVEFVHKKRRGYFPKGFFFFLVIAVVVGTGVVSLFFIERLHYHKTPERSLYVRDYKKEKKKDSERRLKQTPIVRRDLKPEGALGSEKAGPAEIKPPEKSKENKRPARTSGPKKAEASGSGSLREAKDSTLNKKERISRKESPFFHTKDRYQRSEEGFKKSQNTSAGRRGRFFSKASPPPVDSTKAIRAKRDTYLYRARTLELQGHYSRALDYYILAYKLDPQDPDIAKKIGMLYLRQDQCEEAERYLKMVNLKDINALVNLGVCEIKKGDLSMAERYLRQAEGIFRSPFVLYNLGYLMYKKKDYPQAERYLQEALKLADKRIGKKALMVLAAIKESEGDLQEAQRLYLRLQRMDSLTKREQEYISSRLKLLQGVQQ